MGSTEVDIKPATLTDDMPDKSSLAVSVIGKLKHSRYEDVWPEEVHAAFMEAVALYPPMGKRRLKYYRVSSHENEHSGSSITNRAKSFGRCQLIQSYILEKTGKNRSRKQVSSHLQRLKKIHKDDPAMQPLFSERSHPSSEHSCYSAPQAISQDIFADSSVGTRHLKSDPDHVTSHQNLDGGAVTSSIPAYTSEAPPPNSGPCYLNTLSNLSTNIRDQPSFSSTSSTQEFISSVPQQCSALTLYSSDNDYLPELQDVLLFKDAVNQGFRSGSTSDSSAFSTSMRRLTSKLPTQDRLVEPGPTMHLPRAVHPLGFQPTHQWISHNSWMDGISCDSPFTLAQEAFHTRILPLHLIPSEKRRPFSSLASELVWQKFPDLALDPRESSFADLRLRYSPIMYQYSPTYPEVEAATPTFHSSPSETEVSRISRGISYSYAVTSSQSVSESVPDGSAIDFPNHSPGALENLASPHVIRPTPVYPNAYNHSDIHSNMHSGSDSHAPVPSTLL